MNDTLQRLRQVLGVIGYAAQFCVYCHGQRHEGNEHQSRLCDWNYVLSRYPASWQ